MARTNNVAVDSHNDAQTQDDTTAAATVVKTNSNDNDNVNANSTVPPASIPRHIVLEDAYEDNDDADTDNVNPFTEIGILNLDWIREELESDTGDKHQRAWDAYLLEKKQLIDQKKTVGVGKADELVNSTVRDDVKRPPENTSYHKKVGVNGFDVNHKSACGDGAHKRVNFLYLLKHLWPGNPKEHIRCVNTFIRRHNLTKRKRSECTVALLCEQDFLKFFGMMLVAMIEDVPGGNL